MRLKSMLAALMMTAAIPAAQAADVEVTHWWTSGGEAAAVAEFAKAFDATGNKWVDGAIAGSGDVARPIIISRILGGNPMGATQLNPGKDADDLVKAGLMLDLTELAKKEDWANILRPKSQLESCTVDGKVVCVPVNLHSAQWMWTNRKVYKDAGIEPPKNWNEMIAAAPALAGQGHHSAVAGRRLAGRPADRRICTVAIAGVDNFVQGLQGPRPRHRRRRRKWPRCSRPSTRPANSSIPRPWFRSGTKPLASSSPARPPPT